MRSVSRVADVSINTVSKLLVDAGEACVAAGESARSWKTAAALVNLRPIRYAAPETRVPNRGVLAARGRGLPDGTRFGTVTGGTR